MNQVIDLAANNLAQLSISELVRIGRDAIEHAGSFDELRAIAAKADALQAFQRAIGAATNAVNAAAEIRIRAQRRMGQELAKAGISKGRPAENVDGNDISSKLTLAEIGLTRDQSSRYQHLGSIPDESFDAVVEAHEKDDEPLSTASVVRTVADLTSITQEAKEQGIEFSSPGEALEYANTVRHHLTQNTGNNEWYTPARYVEAARAVMGTIDLDPASSAIANQTVRAERLYTVEDDGLAQPWRGNVWLNPPYAQPLIAQFMAKLVAEAGKGTITQAICLVNNSSDTTWFQSTFAAADAVCFSKGRITFIRPDGTPGAPLQGQAFFYFGPNVEAFTEEFRDIGSVSRGGRTHADVGFGDIDAEDGGDVLATDVAVAAQAPLSRDDILRMANRIKAEESEVRKAERAAEIAIAAANVPAVSERYSLIHGQLTDLLDYPAESVDFIITDPPYPREHLPVFGQLGEVAKHLLKPGGLLLCMSGQSYLPEVYAQLGQHLDYHWTMSYLTGGQAPQIFSRRVTPMWKPILAYTKGTYTGEWFVDVARSDANDKLHHHWGQSESGMLDLMRRFVRPGDVVVDPFLGGGTTAVVALELGATFIGCDIAEQAINATKARLVEVG